MKNLLRFSRLSFWFTRAFVKKHGRFLLTGFLAGFLIFLLLVKIFPLIISPFNAPKNKKIAVVGSYTPTNLPSFIQDLISVGLTSLDSSGEASPSLAVSWETKDDGKTYLFKLKNNLVWHDGTSFRTSDVNYNLKDVKFEPITSDLLKISLKEPFSPLPTILSRPLFKRGLVGLGSYKVQGLNLKADKLTSISLQPLSKNLPPLEFKFYPNEESAITAFKLGEVNVLDKLSSSNNFLGQSNISITSRTYYNYNVILFYNLKLPTLQKRNIRQALTYALPQISEEPSLGPINPLSWAYNPNLKSYPPNMELAKSLIDKEGTATTSAELTISTFSSFLPLAQKIVSSWDSLGFKTDIKVENTLPADFDVLLVSQEIPPDPDQYHLWHSTQSTNITGYGSPKVDKLLEDGRKIIDKEKRTQIYKDFQRYLVEDLPAVFLYHPKLYTIERK